MNKIIAIFSTATLALSAFAQAPVTEADWAKFTGKAVSPEKARLRGDGAKAVKGGAFDSKRTECRTEARSESRKAGEGYPNVTFRVVREDRE